MIENMRCELISWSAVEALCQQLGLMIKRSGYRPDMVVAIARGGYVPARLMCDYLDIVALTSIKIEHYRSGANRQERAVVRQPLSVDISKRKVLLVDDVNDSGDTLRVAVDHLQSFRPQGLKVAVLHHKVVSDMEVDYCVHKVVKWRWIIYPWAVKEDVSDFLRRLSPRPCTPAQAQAQLKQAFDMDISLKRLEHVYALMEAEPEDAKDERASL